MLTDRADLHTHSTHSDGLLSVPQLVEKAKEVGLRAFALTDHDTVSGVPEAIEWGKRVGVEVIAGTEVSTRAFEKEAHILGYFIDHQNKTLLGFLESYRQDRLSRVAKMVEKLNKLGIPITLEDVLKKAKGQSVGRPHVADALADGGWVKGYQEAFDKYLYRGGPAYVDRREIKPSEAIEVIHQAGGLAVLAHSLLSLTPEQVVELIKVGLDGIEVFYPKFSPSETQTLEQIARDFKILMTGGSDFHGERGDFPDLGTVTVAYDVVERMKARCASRS